MHAHGGAAARRLESKLTELAASRASFAGHSGAVASWLCSTHSTTAARVEQETTELAVYTEQPCEEATASSPAGFTQSAQPTELDGARTPVPLDALWFV